MRKSLRPLNFALLASSLVVATAWAQEPLRILPASIQKEVQGKDPKDKKDGKDKDKDKDKKKPEILAVGPSLLPESRLDALPRMLPRAPEMLGDQPPLRGLPIVPGGPGGGGAVPGGGGGAATPFLPGPRGFKVADNSSPRPQDRIYFGFQVYNDLFGDQNRAAGAPIGTVNVYREYLGIEKRFFDGNASIDVRLPINTVAVSDSAALSGNHTALGDLGIILRYALWRDWENDNFFTVGAAVTLPTGPSALGGLDTTSNVSHGAVFQPFVAFLWNYRDYYVQGFSALDIPTDTRDVTLWYNDIALGYFLYRTPEPRLLTAVVPTLELHVATPVNNRSNLAYDEVNVGLVTTFEFRHRARLGTGLVFPVTGPRPFTTEALVQLRVLY